MPEGSPGNSVLSSDLRTNLTSVTTDNLIHLCQTRLTRGGLDRCPHFRTVGPLVRDNDGLEGRIVPDVP